jgi:hypothetical protein
VIDRTPNEHITFGLGPHYCLGANLARMEIATVIGALLERLPDLRLAPGARGALCAQTRSSPRSTTCRWYSAPREAWLVRLPRAAREHAQVEGTSPRGYSVFSTR